MELTASRREFLKGVALSAGAGLAAGCVLWRRERHNKTRRIERF